MLKKKPEESKNSIQNLRKSTVYVGDINNLGSYFCVSATPRPT